MVWFKAWQSRAVHHDGWSCALKSGVRHRCCDTRITEPHECPHFYTLPVGEVSGEDDSRTSQLVEVNLVTTIRQFCTKAEGPRSCSIYRPPSREVETSSSATKSTPLEGQAGALSEEP